MTTSSGIRIHDQLTGRQWRTGGGLMKVAMGRASTESLYEGEHPIKNLALKDTYESGSGGIQ